MLWAPGHDLPDEKLFALVMAWLLQAKEQGQLQVGLPFWAVDRLVELAEKGAKA